MLIQVPVCVCPFAHLRLEEDVQSATTAPTSTAATVLRRSQDAGSSTTPVAADTALVDKQGPVWEANLRAAFIRDIENEWYEQASAGFFITGW